MAAADHIVPSESRRFSGRWRRWVWVGAIVVPVVVAIGWLKMSRESNIVVRDEADDESGNQRLTLKYVRRGSAGMDFDSLVWEIKLEQGWTTKKAITRAAFEAGSRRRRWISEIHSFDAQRGRSILKVAEGDVPDGQLPVHFAYSWREWDVATNKELRLIRECASPFEPFDVDAHSD
jgi:hypothetical protein